MNRIIYTQKVDSLSLKYNELFNEMKDWIIESINCLGYLEDVERYEDISIEDYGIVEDVWDDEGNMCGQGVNFINCSIILNEETEEQLNQMFEEARDEAYEGGLEEFASQIWDEVKDYTPYPEEDSRSYDFCEWVANGEPNSCFLSEDIAGGRRVYKIPYNQSKVNWVNVMFEDDKIYKLP